jgi:hypothetical protein
MEFWNFLRMFMGQLLQGTYEHKLQQFMRKYMICQLFMPVFVRLLAAPLGGHAHRSLQDMAGTV